MNSPTYYFHPTTAKVSVDPLEGPPVEWVVETGRTWVRRMIPEDLDWLYQLHSDPDVMRYIRVPDASPEETKQKMEEIFHDPLWKIGHGLYPIHWKETGEVVGWFLWKNLEQSEVAEVGYRLFPSFWNMGIATEVTQQFLQHLREREGLEYIAAVTHLDNQASQKVLEKAGMKRVGIQYFYQTNVWMFEWKADE